jgi:multicomponent Na+:H+ antiporter subunit D
VVSVLTLFSMTKIWAEAYWKDRPAESAPLQPLAVQQRSTLLMPVILLAALTVILGIGAEPLLTLGTEAAAQLLNPSEYIQAVLGGGA